MRLALCIVGCGQYARAVLDQIHDMTEDFELAADHVTRRALSRNTSG